MTRRVYLEKYTDATGSGICWNAILDYNPADKVPGLTSSILANMIIEIMPLLERQIVPLCGVKDSIEGLSAPTSGQPRHIV